jgi:hypothetical protein
MVDDLQSVSSPALGNFPPNRTININPDFRSGPCPLAKGGVGTATIETLSAIAKLATAVHELGHNLGFAHPRRRAGAVHIPGTAENRVPEPPNECEGLACVSYSTVMLGRGCLANLTTLRQDDIASANKKYPSCRTVCETNCLSLSDHGSIGLCMAACPQQCGG